MIKDETCAAVTKKLKSALRRSKTLKQMALGGTFEFLRVAIGDDAVLKLPIKNMEGVTGAFTWVQRWACECFIRYIAIYGNAPVHVDSDGLLVTDPIEAELYYEGPEDAEDHVDEFLDDYPMFECVSEQVLEYAMTPPSERKF